MKNPVIILLIVVILLVIGLGVYQFLGNRKSKDETTTKSTTDPAIDPAVV